MSKYSKYYDKLNKQDSFKIHCFNIGIAQKLHNEICRRDITEDEASDILGITYNTLQSILNGEFDMDIKFLVSLFNKFDLDIKISLK